MTCSCSPSRRGAAPPPDTHILSDAAERADSVGAYGKSLLYLVSRAFQPERDTPLLGMQAHLEAAADVRRLLAPGLVVAKEKAARGSSRATTHGGFDNDPETMNSILRNILGREPAARDRFIDRGLVF